MLSAHLKGLIRDAIENQKNTLKDEAMKNTDPNAIHFRFPGAEKLERMFRITTDTVMEAFVGNKNDPFYGFFRAIEKELGIKR